MLHWSSNGLLTVRLVAILPWFADLFTAIAAIVLFMAASRVLQVATTTQAATTTEAGPVTPTDTEAMDEKDPDVKAQSHDSP